LASFPRDLEKYDKKAQYDYFTSTLDNYNNNNDITTTTIRYERRDRERDEREDNKIYNIK